MPEIFFYKVRNSSSELFLISLIEKSISKNWNAVILMDNIERMEELNDLLWTYDSISFIPHGGQSDMTPERQKVYLTCAEENPNKSEIIFSIDGVVINKPENWKRCVYIFNEQNLKVTEDLESYKREIQKLDYKQKYFEQDKNEKWISKD